MPDFSSVATVVGELIRSGAEIGAGVAVWQDGHDPNHQHVTSQATGPDLVLGQDVSWTLGFLRDSIEIGMGGVGGSSGWLAFDRAQAVAYVTRGLKDHDRADMISAELSRLALLSS